MPVLRKMTPPMRAKWAFPGSVYLRPCPECGAQPYEFCVSIHSHTRSGDQPHVQRSADYLSHGNTGKASRHRSPRV